MNNNRAAQLILLGVSFLLLAGCSGKKASEEVGYGTLANSIYQHDFFGFKMAFPTNWTVLDDAARKKATEGAMNTMVSQNPGLQGVAADHGERTVHLLAAFKHPFEQRVTFNAHVTGTADRVSDQKDIKTGKDYLLQVQNAMASPELRPQFEEISTENLGGMDFHVMKVSMRIQGIKMQQKYYAAIIKGYSLLFVSNFIRPEEELALKDIMASLSFK